MFNITLIEVELSRHSQSWISLLRIGYSWYERHLLLVEWNYRKDVEHVQVLFIKFR